MEQSSASSIIGNRGKKNVPEMGSEPPIAEEVDVVEGAAKVEAARPAHLLAQILFGSLFTNTYQLWFDPHQTRHTRS